MTGVVTSKGELVVPKSVRRRAGIKTGDRVEFMISGRVINIIPKLPYADDTFSSEETALIARARREMREGKYLTLAELEHELAHKRPPRRRKTT
jgi:AbrB family looped-hinge helix DNA binding protein